MAQPASDAVSSVVKDVVARALRDVLAGKIVVPGVSPALEPGASEEDADMRHVARLLEGAQNVIVMAGAGLSTAAGIPDFRTPGTGLYYQLEKYELPDPQAVFDIDYFRTRPEPFHMLAREMWPGKFAPTDAHAFIRLLADEGKLLRCYTQNIDGLERLAGVPPDKLVECHGTFATAHAIDPPKKEFEIGWYKAQLDSGNVQIRCPETNSLIKPDIVFFGEKLPENFLPSVQADFPQCDLLIIIGTSLTVMPFAGLVRYVGPTVPRVLVNMVAAGGKFLNFAGDEELAAEAAANAAGAPPSDGEKPKRRDFALLGDLQRSVRALARLAGWQQRLQALAEAQRARIGECASNADVMGAAARADALAGEMVKLGL